MCSPMNSSVSSDELVERITCAEVSGNVVVVVLAVVVLAAAVVLAEVGLAVVVRAISKC